MSFRPNAVKNADTSASRFNNHLRQRIWASLVSVRNAFADMGMAGQLLDFVRLVS
jgi:hypothetical protein